MPVTPASTASSSASSDVVIEVAGLVVRYPRVLAVDDLSFRVSRGLVTAFLGPNGAGKTTTLEVCEGLRRPTAGNVRVLGSDPGIVDAQQRARVGVMLQAGGVPSSARAVEFLRHVSTLHAQPLDVDALADRLDLPSFGRTPYRRLSGGQKQSLALAVALVGRPELVLLDEPTAGLDPAARIRTWELIEDLRRDGVSVVLSTHYLEEAQRLADNVLIMDRGSLVADGSLADLTADGSDHVMLRTSPSARADELAAGLNADSDAGSAAPYSVHAQGDGLLITGASSETISAAVSRWCSRNGLVITGLATGRRTLEDVFFERTGRPLS